MIKRVLNCGHLRFVEVVFALVGLTGFNSGRFTRGADKLKNERFILMICGRGDHASFRERDETLGVEEVAADVADLDRVCVDRLGNLVVEFIPRADCVFLRELAEVVFKAGGYAARIVAPDFKMLADVFINVLKAVVRQTSENVTVFRYLCRDVLIPFIVGGFGHLDRKADIDEPRDRGGALLLVLQHLNGRLKSVEFVGRKSAYAVNFADRAPVFTFCRPYLLFERGAETERHFAGVLEHGAFIARQIDGRVHERKLHRAVVLRDLPVAFEVQAFALFGNMREFALDYAEIGTQDVERRSFDESVRFRVEDALDLDNNLLVGEIH